jgi:hypothetical protein
MSKAAEVWTLSELTGLASQALAVDYPGSPNGQIRDVPDQRTIRYYTTLGLLDRPVSYRGRNALYRRRHLLQLVAIKRLQAEGLTLRDVQQRLLGLAETGLEKLARLPKHLERPTAKGEAAPPVPPGDQRRGAFWKAVPEPASAAPAIVSGPAAPLQGIPLAEDVLLLWPPTRPVSHEDIESLRSAGAPLLHVLQSRRLYSRAEKGDRL